MIEYRYAKGNIPMITYSDFDIVLFFYNSIKYFYLRNKKKKEKYSTWEGVMEAHGKSQWESISPKPEQQSLKHKLQDYEKEKSSHGTGGNII